TDPIAKITSQGIVDAVGTERVYDVIICATGFHTDKFLAALNVRGKSGLHIREAWSDGAKAYRGITTNGFPNLFMIYGPNTNGASIITMIEDQADYIRRHIEWMDANGVATIEVKPEAERQYNDELQALIGQVKLWHGSCHNYYFSAS